MSSAARPKPPEQKYNGSRPAIVRAAINI